MSRPKTEALEQELYDLLTGGRDGSTPDECRRRVQDLVSRAKSIGAGERLDEAAHGVAFVQTYPDHFAVIRDGVGLCQTKSRTVAREIREALNAKRHGINGQTIRRPVRWTRTTHPDGTWTDEPVEWELGVVLALLHEGFILIRNAQNKLDFWPPNGREIVEPAPPPPEELEVAP